MYSLPLYKHLILKKLVQPNILISARLFWANSCAVCLEIKSWGVIPIWKTSYCKLIRSSIKKLLKLWIKQPKSLCIANLPLNRKITRLIRNYWRPWETNILLIYLISLNSLILHIAEWMNLLRDCIKIYKTQLEPLKVWKNALELCRQFKLT